MPGTPASYARAARKTMASPCRGPTICSPIERPPLVRPHGMLAAGSRVRLSNETGNLELEVAISDMVAPGVAHSVKGRWPRSAGPNRANVNTLNPGVKSDMGESSAVHGVEVEISAV